MKYLKVVTLLFSILLFAFSNIERPIYAMQEKPVSGNFPEKDAQKISGLPKSSDCIYWGKIKDIEMWAPFAKMDIHELLSVSIGAMSEDIIRDGLPWFGVKRDDFKGKTRKHMGLDFYGDKLQIRAMADGKIVLRQTEEKAGYYVKIDHGSGIQTLYMHLNKPYEGLTEIKQGDILGLTGISGNAISPQLHLAIIVDGKYIDPMMPLKEIEVENVQELIKYYETLYPEKISARDHFVKSYLASDDKIKLKELQNGLMLLRNICYDKNVSDWLKKYDESKQ